jgi:hypothetical protein
MHGGLEEGDPTMSVQQKGYAYRLYPLTLDELKAYITQHVFAPPDAGKVFAFGGNTVDLSPIANVATVDAIPFQDEHGPFTFGHVFSQQGELRWKRRGKPCCQKQDEPHQEQQGKTYDALLLTENGITVLSGQALDLSSPLTVREPKNDNAWIVLNPRAKYGRLGYKEYVGANQAVYFVRYTHVS